MPPSTTTALVIEWTFISLSALVVSLRGYTRLSRQNTSLQIADYFLFAAWIVALTLGGLATREYVTGELSTADILAHAFTVADLKFLYAITLCYDFGLYLSKASLLAFYFRLIPKPSTKSRIALWVVLVYVVCAFITTCGVDLFICYPTSKNWSLNPDHCDLYSTKTQFRTVWSINISCDLAVFILPFPVIWNLKLGQREKRGVLSIFGLGAITMAVSVARYIALATYLDTVSTYIFSAAAFNISIIVVALPSLNVLLKSSHRKSDHSFLIVRQNISPPESIHAKDPF